eukprot:m.78240 g.78240  ORF g.78240 m.78240 type:complete len:488 (-) comp50555_c0_seq1:132-1595(-)
MTPRKLQNLIDGAFAAPHSGHYIDSLDPSTGALATLIPDSDEHDVTKAVAAATAAFPKWSKLPRQTRADFLRKIADAIEARLDEFAAAESHDQGKPVWLARTVDIPRAIHNFRFFAGSVLHTTDKSSIHDTAQCVNYTVRTPVGVAALITPWNLPLYLLTWKIAPALATGNTVVAKPSEITSLTAFMLAEIMGTIGLPAGVCNFVFGLGSKVGPSLVSHPAVPLISFTGGTVTGNRISVLAAAHRKKLSLELGGKNPCIIFEDVDVDRVARETVRSSFTNQGEICLCSSRIYVHEKIFDEYVAKFALATQSHTVGVPSDPNTKMGPVVSKEHLHKIQSYIQLAIDDGATIVTGGLAFPEHIPDANKNGFFQRPTIITGLTDTSRCMKEEIFGPVVCVVPFKTEEEVIHRANDNEYGLSAVIWTNNVSRANRVALQLETGTVWINCWMVRDLNMPFGGVKASGVGRESAEDSFDFYTEAKTICTSFAP